MRAGHIRRRAHEGAQDREVIGGCAPGVRNLVVRLIEHRVHPSVTNGDWIPYLVGEAGHRRLIELRVFLVVVAEASFEQQPAGLRPRPLGDVDEARWCHLHTSSLRRHG